MKKNKQYIFVIYVYEYADGSEFLNSVKVELRDENIKSAEKRALELAGTKDRKKVHTTAIIETNDDRT